MENERKIYLYDVSDINWQELAMLNIFQQDIEDAGQMDTFLRGEETDVISFRNASDGVNFYLDASLQISEQEDTIIVNVKGIEATHPYIYEDYMPEEEAYFPE